MKYPFNKDFRKIAFKLPFSKLICRLSQLPLEIIIKFIRPPKNLTVRDFYINGFENQKILVKEISPQMPNDFSKALNIPELFSYAKEVKICSEKMILDLTGEALKTKISPEKKSQLQNMNVVSADESSVWLIDYWCGKDFRGLLQMPFSRHWIMHIEACQKIAAKIAD